MANPDRASFSKLFNKHPLPLARLGLLLLCAAWLLPGLVGHAPWKGGDGEHFVQLWLLLKSGATPQSVSATPPLYYWVATATAWLTSSFLSLADGARLASGLFIALALFFIARTARALYGAETAWAAALTLLGCMGLLVRGHELNAATAQLAAAAIMLHGIATLPQGPRGGWALGAGAILMLLAGGAAGSTRQSRNGSTRTTTWVSSGLVGAVPAAKRSRRVDGQAADGSMPPSAQISTSATPGGRANGRGGRPRWAASITACQIGPAPETPLIASIGRPSALPTQTPTTRSGV